MKALVIKNYHNTFNEYNYIEGQELEVFEVEEFFIDEYVILYENTIDFIPKKTVLIIS